MVILIIIKFIIKSINEFICLFVYLLYIEPTTGLDPDNKNHVWSIIQSLKSPDRLILMTTHSMEEAEALCSRIGIMARGELQCIGTSQHLKKKYGKGYTLTVNLLKYNSNIINNNGNNNIELLLNENEREQRYDNETEKKLIEYVTGSLSFGHGKLLSSINRTKKFLLPKEIGAENNVLHISHIFKEMEMNKNLLNIREWGLSMSTLEDVFISAVKNTHEEDDDNDEKEKEKLSLEKSYLNMKTNLETKDSIDHDSQKLLENSSLSIESSKSESERFQL